jgi:hypothetical protein
LVAPPEQLENRHLLSGLSATYYDNPDFTGASVTRVDSTVNFDWKSGTPDSRIAADSFSAQWTGQIRSLYSEQYTLTVQADNAARLWVNGQLLVDQWNGSSVNASGKITLEAGRLNDVILQYREDTGNAKVKLFWSSAHQPSQVVPAGMMYPPSTAASPLPGAPTTTLSVRDFGATGNGSSDDAPEIQAAINALPAFGTLNFEPRTYKLNTGLVINKPMQIQGNGALLLLNTSNWPNNRTVTIRSELSSSSVGWNEKVVAGQSTFHPTFAPGRFVVGQWVFVELGQDPNDKNEQNYTAMVPVTAVGTNSVTLALSVPYNINAGAYPNKITPVSGLATQVHIRNLKFDHVSGTVPDASIWIERARNSTIDGISGRFEIMANVADSANVTISNATASLVNDASAAARALTVWQSDYLTMSNVRVDTAFDKAVFYSESWARGTRISNVDVDWRATTNPVQNAVFHLTGGSYNTNIDQVRIRNAGPIMLAGQGGQNASYHFGTVSISGPVRAAPLSLVDDLTVGSSRYAGAVKKTITFKLSSNLNWVAQQLVKGTIKSLKLTVSDGGVLDRADLVNAFGQGGNVVSALTPGQAVDIWAAGFLGSDYPLNDASNGVKNFVLVNKLGARTGATLTAEVEYYPPTS